MRRKWLAVCLGVGLAAGVLDGAAVAEVEAREEIISEVAESEVEEETTSETAETAVSETIKGTASEASETAVSEAIEETASEADAVPEITIWVDGDSEAVVREALYSYAFGSDMPGYEEYFPELTWRLVDKSYLTPEQFEEELLRELDGGGGPDLIFMDEANGVSPEYLMESGYLAEIGNVETYVVGKLSYLPGTLEAGQVDGRQYVLPVYIQCPAVFGLRDTLEAAGIDTEQSYESLDAFLEAFQEAADATGKTIFENAADVDWIEACCAGQRGDQTRKAEQEENCMADTEQEENHGEDAAGEGETDRLQTLLAETRQRSGNGSSFFAPYEALSSGASMLSGCMLTNKSKAAQNMALFEDEKDLVFFSIPSRDGAVRAMITQSVAVNANTRYPAEATALLRAFQGNYVSGDGSIYLTDDFPASGVTRCWKNQLKTSAVWAEYTYKMLCGEEKDVLSLSGEASKAFRECTQKAVTDAAFRNQCSDENGHADVPEKQVLTVSYGDWGLGEDYPLYQWLSAAAKSYSNEHLHVQLIPRDTAHNSAVVDAKKMEMVDAGADIFLGVKEVLEMDFDGAPLGECYADLTPYLQGAEKALPVVKVLEKDRGLAYGTEEESGDTSVFVISESSTLKEEAFGFCAAALGHETYADAMEQMGYLPGEAK